MTLWICLPAGIIARWWPPLRVLLVEDRPEFATLISTLLADAGVEVDLEVVDGVAAGLAALEARSCDCVFFDFGGRAAERDDAVRRTAAAASPVPVIVLTADPDPQLADRLRRAGALDVVTHGALDAAGMARLMAHVAARLRSRAPLAAHALPPIPRWVDTAPLVGSAAAAGVGVVAVIGWIGGLDGLLSWGAAPTIKLNTALCLIAGGGLMVLLHRPSPRRRRLARVTGAVVGCAAALTLLEWVLGRSLGIDQLLVQDPATAGVPGRASPHTALALLLFVGALLTLDGRSLGARRLHLLLTGGFLAAVVLAALGWLYGAGALSGGSRVTGLSLPTLAGLVALLVGLVSMRPAARPFVLFRGDSPASTLMRWLIPAALLVPPLLGGLRLLGEQAGWYDGRFGLALFATSMVVALVTLVITTAREIDRGDSERRAAERTLGDSELRFRTLAKLAPLGILESDVGGACTYANPAWCEQTGLSPREAWDRGWIAAVHPDDRDDVVGHSDTASAEHEDATLAYRVRRPDGSERFIREHRAVLRDQTGSVTGHVRMTIDVTEVRRAAEAARVVQSRLQAILDHLPVGIYLRGLDERYQLVNAYFASEFGRPVDEIIGRTALELHPGALVDWARELERPIHERGETVSSESSAPHADGTDHHHWVIKYPVTGDDGELIGIGGAVLDITARRQAELALANAEAEQAALLRVATAVAEDLGPGAVFELVAEEVARLLSCEVGVVLRFESDAEASVLGVWSADPTITIDRVIKLDGTTASSLVARTGRTARIDYGADGVAGIDARAGVAAPITIAGRLWGAVGAGTTGDGVLPADAEERVAHFAGLAATAIGNAEARETLARHAATDALTGLPNYRTFHDRLRSEGLRATRHSRQLSLVLIDVDHFKAINDEHGHSVGDEVLRQLAQRLAAQLRGSDVVARVGGEEFAWLLPETDALSAFAVTERARTAIERTPFAVAGTVTISAGVCSLEDSGDVDLMLRHADSALYWAKDCGRNATFRYTEAARVALVKAPPPTQRFQSMSSIRALARVIDAKNRATSHHSERVADLSEKIALDLGWTTKRARQLHEAATLHDIGKIATPDAILLKPGRLTPDEYAETQRHAVVGAQIAAEVLEPEAVAWIRHHHEHWDGRGYPQQLSGHGIPDGAQIIGLCEAMDAMTHRLYRTALSYHDALEECTNQRGRQFAPDVVDALLRTAARDLEELPPGRDP